MAGLFDYLEWRGDLSFEESPFNEVDAAILCQIEYNDFYGIVPSEFTKKGPSLYEVSRKFLNQRDYLQKKNADNIVDERLVDILQKAAETRRFSGLRLCGYVENLDYEKQEQFSAVTFSWQNHFKSCNCITFRGTDTTLIGWKEDFNMVYMDTVPSQRDALDYLLKMQKFMPGEIIINGHSKGGNIALYSAVNCGRMISRKITDIYILDGPGFREEFFEQEGYKAIRRKEHSFLPKSSLIGMLFQHSDGYTTIDSNQKGGILQHDPFSWQVSGKHFVEVSDVDDEARYLAQALNDWMYDVPLDQREYFIETVFKVLSAPEVKTATEFSANKFSNVLKVIKAAAGLDSKTKDTVFKVVQVFFKLARGSYAEMKSSQK